MDFYNLRIADYKTKMKKSGMDTENAPFNLRTKDIRNGFIAYDLPAVEGYEEMAYYIPTASNKFVALVSFGCGPECEASMPIFYEIDKGKLVETTQKYISEATFAQIDEGMNAARTKIKLTDPENSLTRWVKVPQKGTTIQIGFNENLGETNKFYVIYELVYDKKDAGFKLVKKQ